MLAPLSRDARRMVAIQLLRDGVFFRRWHGNQPAAPAPNGNGKIEPKDGAGWQPLCDTDPLDEFGIRP
ncbi:MAG TPA: hypothetical protein VNK91_09450 [Burkholderiaceae bacterium]|nr:hypothetical protein [Burkholderiaceae bacterium]